MAKTCTCGHRVAMHAKYYFASARTWPCLLCQCRTYTPAPAGGPGAPPAADPEEPAGAPMPHTSEPTCDTCHRLLSCVGTCPKGCPQ